MEIHNNLQINKIKVLISQMQKHHSGNLTIAQKWMKEHTEDPLLKKTVTKLSITSYLIIDELHNRKELIGSDIANQIGITRGGISRAARILEKENIIKTSKHSNNNKNIYYQLTDFGNQIFELHFQMHQALYKTLQDKINQEFSSQELDTIIRFLKYIKKNNI